MQDFPSDIYNRQALSHKSANFSPSYIPLVRLRGRLLSALPFEFPRQRGQFIKDLFKFHFFVGVDFLLEFEIVNKANGFADKP